MSRAPSQLKGTGSPLYRRRTHGSTTFKVCYGPTIGTIFVNKLVRSTFHSAPVMECISSGVKFHAIAPIGVIEGQTILAGSPGELVRLDGLAPGDQVCMVERIPLDGGVLARSAGMYGVIAYTTASHVGLNLNGRSLLLLKSCRALRGRAGGGEAYAKPLLKAGNVFYKRRSKSMKYPHVSRVAMNHHEHRHGSSDRKRLGGRGCYARNAPPGQKCALIAPKFSGRGRKNSGSK